MRLKVVLILRVVATIGQPAYAQRHEVAFIGWTEGTISPPRQLKQFAAGDVLESIVVAVTVDATDAGANVQQANGLLSQGSTAKFKNNTFLEVKGGKRIFLQEYQTPRPDGFGARFIFQRMVDDKPFITPESDEIHFFTELSSTYRLDRRYKTKDMMYEGKLEY